MRLFWLTLFAVALPACSGSKDNFTDFGETSAFIGSLVGQWTSGCINNESTSEIKEILFKATDGVLVSKSYKGVDCKGAPSHVYGPSSFTYTIVDKPSAGEATLMLQAENDKPWPAKTVLFNDVMSLNIFGTPVSYQRVVKGAK